MDLHRIGEERSIEMHAEIARRLRAEPGLLDSVRRRLDESLASGLMHPGYAARWKELIARPLDELCAALVDPSEEARALRQSTPFVGILDAPTRWRIWREVGERCRA